MRRTVQWVWSSLLLAAVMVGNAQADSAAGLRSPGADELWPRWQGRILVGTVAPVWRHLGWDAADAPRGERLDSLSVLGDYYFAPVGPSSGFRATSGLIIGTASNRSLSSFGALGLRPALAPIQRLPGDQLERGTLPYLGLGYTRVSTRQGWGFSADIGLIARNPGSAVRLGRAFGGGQPLDELLRDMRLSPLVNLGVSYSF
jgi:hypothetical protein